MGGPDMAPHTPQRYERPSGAGALLDHRQLTRRSTEHGGPRHGPPYPPALRAPQRSRSAPRSPTTDSEIHRAWGAPTWPPIPPSAPSAPAEPERSSITDN